MRVFLCHSSDDKPSVRDLYKRLRADGFAPWLDEESLAPGQEWKEAIADAVRAADVVLVCLSKSSIAKTGFVQKEIAFALDHAAEKPEGSIYVIPARLEECDVPKRLGRWQWIDLFAIKGYQKLVQALRAHKSYRGPVLKRESGAGPRARNKPVELLVSCSHHDALWLERLLPLLWFEDSRDNAYLWDDQRMKAGDRWDKEIRAALERMDVFICLVSMGSLRSRYIYDVELSRALKREIEIVPIMIDPNIPLKDECPDLLDFNPLPAWGKCWRDYGDYRDAHGLIRAGLREAIGKARNRRP
jgi:hypothetical protein